MANPSFDERTLSFLNWFTALPGATFHPHIQIQDLRQSGQGRGIVATSDIAEETELFKIPRAAIINTLTSDLAKKIPQVFEDSTEGLENNEADEEGDTSGAPDSWVSLILVMIYEFMQGENSKWKPYFDIMPESFDTLMFWPRTDLGGLQASAISAKIGKDEADNMFRAKVLPVIEEHAQIFYPEGSKRMNEEELLNLAHRMGSTVMAYAFDLENDDEEPEEEGDEWVEDKEGKLMMGMVPMADVLNADVVFNAHVNHEDDFLTVTSLKPISAGQQVLNYYGPLSNSELLRRYGYVTSNHARYDVVELSWNMVLSVLKDHLRLDESTWGQAINQLDEEETEDTFVIDRDLDEPDSRGDVHGEVKLQQLPADLEEQIATFLKAVRKVSPASIPDKRKRDEISAAVIHQALQLRLAEYPTSEAEDQALLQDAKFTDRQKMAIVVRLGEKKLLGEAIQAAAAKINTMARNGDDASSEPSAKRQKSSR
ncbi:SET domain-containing protein RMS1 [Apiospora kogelbergensis]|uniref:SET domain-containing protein RMS1 n=1 Tax=Apiospora kogelbergensis TaxID=1337665 RepID=UPI0031305943